MTLRGWLAATGALALALILALAWGVRVDHLRARHAAALAKARQDYRAAQAKAQTDFDAQVAALRVHNRRLNDAAEQKSEALTLVYRDRVVRLPAAHAACTPDRPGLPAPGDAQPVDRSSRDPILLDRADALICATNTARLEAARAWALEMQTGP